MTKAELIALVAFLEEKREEAGTRHRLEVAGLNKQINDLIEAGKTNATAAAQDHADLILLLKAARPVADATAEWKWPDDAIALSRKLTFGALRKLGCVTRAITPR